MTRTHCVQITTEDGVYLLCYASQANAFIAYNKLKATTANDELWLEATDDEETSLLIRVDSFHSAVLAPFPEPPTLESIFRIKKEKAN